MLFKYLYDQKDLPPLVTNHWSLTNPQLVTPDAKNAMPTLLEEICYAFEPAIVFTKALREAVEKEQAIHDELKQSYKAEGKNPDDIPHRRIYAFCPLAYMKHIDNLYDIMPAFTSQDFIYLERGYAEAYTAVFGVPFQKKLKEIDQPLKEMMTKVQYPR